MDTKEAKILIVDDMPDHIAFAGAILKENGYKVYAVTSGEAALNFLKKKLPDLIVLDINMKGLTGFEVCGIVKKQPETKDIPVIFLTAETSSEKIRQGFEIGCCDYVSKPFVKEEYLARINTHINISRHSRELAAAYDELNLFCSAVSHDLKAPLNVIPMLIDTLHDELNENHNNEALKIADMISAKSQNLTLMIERLLEFSKMCNIKPQMKLLNFNAMLEEAFYEQKSLNPNRNITLISDNLPNVYADEILMGTVLKNIMTNSFKFTRNRTNAVITTNSFTEDGCTVISVKDNGAGFDMKYSDKLFGIFQRLHSEESFEGSGVGLAMIDRVMKRHGGRVRITGEVDKGAEIFLYFKQ